MRLMILGRTEVLYEAARQLAGEHEIVLIVTAPAAPEYRRTEEDFRGLARELNCECLVTRRLGEQELAAVARARPNLVVSMNWVSVLDGSLFDAVPGGILNAHFGDLPRYRGNAVINWAMLKHEPSIALTIHFMQPGLLDTGPIAAQETVPLTSSTTIGEIMTLVEQRVPALFVAAVRGVAEGRPPRPPRAEAGGFRCYPRVPGYSKIDWSASARDIDALVRASGRPFSGAFTYQDDGGRLRRITVWTSRVVSESTEDLGVPGHVIRNDARSGESWVLTGQGILAICEAEYDGEPPFAPGAVWRSIRMRLGVDLESIVMDLQRRLGPNTP